MIQISHGNMHANFHASFNMQYSDAVQRASKFIYLLLWVAIAGVNHVDISKFETNLVQIMIQLNISVTTLKET